MKRSIRKIIAGLMAFACCISWLPGEYVQIRHTDMTAVSAADQETVTEYRYCTRTTKTSNTPLGEPWILESEVTGYTDWGAWSDWSTNYAATSDTCEVQTEQRTGDPESYVMVNFRTRGTNYKVSTPSGLKVRTGPGTSYSSVGAAPNGTSFTIDQISGKWGHTNSISCTNGTQSGWLYLGYCTGGLGNVQYRSESVNGNYEANGLSSTFGEYVGGPYTISADQVHSARTVAPGGWAEVVEPESNYDGWNMSAQTGYIMNLDTYSEFVWFIQETNYSQQTWYRHRDRELETTYTYYTISDWSEWTQTPITATDTIIVETREVVVSEEPAEEEISPTPENTFDFSTDIWNFTNTKRYFLPLHFNEKYRSMLEANLSPTEYEVAYDTYKYLTGNFNGVCYGMSVLALLYQEDYLNPSDYTAGAKTLKEIAAPNNDDVESLIIYYFLLQKTEKMKFEAQKCRSASTNNQMMKNMMRNAIDKAAAASQGNSPVVINYGWSASKSAENDKGWAHSVLAYGVEYGSWDLAEGYDGRILIYDCSKGEFSDDACIYFKSDTLEWYIPYKELRYTENAERCYAKLFLVSNNINMLNTGGCLGQKSNTDAEEIYPGITVNSADVSIRKTNVDDRFAVNSSDLEDESEIYSTVDLIGAEEEQSGYSYFMTDRESGYTVMSNTDQLLKADMRYADILTSANAENAHQLTFLPDASISISGYDTDYSIDVTTDENLRTLPWYNLHVDGSTGSSVSLRPYQDGYLLEGDLNGCIDAAARNYSNGQTVSSLPLDDYSSAYITETYEYGGMLNILVDQDDDGIYETSVLNKIKGDANGDGTVDAFDLAITKRYMLYGKSMINLYSADLNNSGTVSVTDLIGLQKYLLNQN